MIALFLIVNPTIMLSEVEARVEYWNVPIRLGFVLRLWGIYIGQITSQLCQSFSQFRRLLVVYSDH